MNELELSDYSWKQIHQEVICRKYQENSKIRKVWFWGDNIDCYLLLENLWQKCIFQGKQIELTLFPTDLDLEQFLPPNDKVNLAVLLVGLNLSNLEQALAGIRYLRHTLKATETRIILLLENDEVVVPDDWLVEYDIANYLESKRFNKQQCNSLIIAGLQWYETMLKLHDKQQILSHLFNQYGYNLAYEIEQYKQPENTANHLCLQQQVEQRLQEITAEIPAMIFQLNVNTQKDYHLEFISDGLKDIYELTVQEWQNQQLPEFIDYCLNNIGTSEYKIVTPRGQEKWLKANLVSKVIGHGTQVISGIVLDVSDQLNEQALESQRARQKAEAASQAKTQFLALISHEIRTTINVILGFCELLQQHRTQIPASSYLEVIASSGKTLLALLNDFLDISKIEAGQLKLTYSSVDIVRLLQEVGYLFSERAKQKRLDLIIDCDDNLPQLIEFDELRLRQILFNLISNSLKFTEEGYIKITLKSCPTTKDDKINLEIRVEDTGIGIPHAEQERVFEAFTQVAGQSLSKYGGTGLGLLITKQLTELLGGRITLFSEPQQGSHFIVEFPEIKVIEPRSKPAANNFPSLSPDVSHPISKRLLENLWQIQEKVWPDLCRTMITSKVRLFAQQMEKWGQEEDCPPLLEYAQVLQKKLECFDIEGYTQIVQSFPSLLERLNLKN